MIDGYTIKFGYGDVGVGALFTDIGITIQQIKPPLECGETCYPGKVEFIGDRIDIIIYNKSDNQSISKFISLLDRVTEREIDTFFFNGYIFDFTNFNIKSIDTIKRKLDISIANWCRTAAC